MVAKVRFKCLFSLEFVLKESVNFDEMSLDSIELVSWHRLRVKNDKVVVEHVALDESSEIRATAT